MRSVSQIYAEAVETRNNYLQLTELDSGRSDSKLSIINLITYVAAVCIHTYEALLDLFEVRINEALTTRISGTPEWYIQAAKKFQYNEASGTGDELTFNEDTLRVEYVTVDTSRRIVENAAYQLENNALTLKVCKANDNTDEVDNGVPYMPLSDSELTAFKMFIQQIKFVGADVYCESSPGDIITVRAGASNPIYYDDSYITAEQAMTNIRTALAEFANDMEFNGTLYYQAVLDVIRKTQYITDVGSGVKIYVQSYDDQLADYGAEVELTGRTRLKSGYIRFMDADSLTTVNTDNITLIPASQAV